MICFLIMSFLPNLLAATKAPFYRCCAGLTALIIIFFARSLKLWLTFLPKKVAQISMTVILIFVCITGIIQANRTLLYYRVLPSSVENRFVINTIKKWELTKNKSILFVLPGGMKLKIRYDEFGTISTHFYQDLFGILNCAFTELGRENELFENEVVIAGSLEPLDFSNLKRKPFIIDTTTLFTVDGPLEYLNDK